MEWYFGANHHFDIILTNSLYYEQFIRNIKKYLLAALYNATFTMGSYYSALVQHDMAADGQGRRY